MSHYLESVAEQHNFRLGKKHIKNLEELLIALKNTSEEEFNHYVGEEHNHFVNWIDEIVKDHKLAKQLIPIKERIKTIHILESRIQELKKANNNKNQDHIDLDWNLSKTSIKDNKVHKKKTDNISSQKTDNASKNFIEEEKHLKNYTKFYLDGLAMGIIIGIILGFILAKIINLG